MRSSVEAARGCGYRQPGGLYLVADEPSEACPKLPVETSTCPCCGVGIRPARGYTWVDADMLLKPEKHGSIEHDVLCPLGSGRSLGRAGLIWIGERFYPSPAAFLSEASRMGISRRITAVPRDFEIGETWVLLAHKRAIQQRCDHCEEYARGGGLWADAECEECGGDGVLWKPGVFTLFQPSAIEYIVRGDETDEELEALEKRGIEPVEVIRANEQQEVPA
jgi:hypothetical protein